jgi:hypothetical protein
MIIWINGPFGGGKTSLADGLLGRLEGASLFDPEEVGFMLRALLPDRARDFQDLPPWRPLVAATAVELYRYHGGAPLVAPMTLLRREYATEIFDAIRMLGITVRHLILHVDTPVLVERIAGHDMFPDDVAHNGKVQEFRTRKVPAYELAYRDWLTDAGEVIDTTTLAPRDVLESALNVLTMS